MESETTGRDASDPSTPEKPGSGRRDFLRVGAAAGVATAGAACVPTGRTPWSGTVPKRKPLGKKEMTAYVAQVDRGLAEIAKGGLLEGIVKAKSGKGAPGIDHLDEKEQLVKGAISALYFTGMYNDLPEENRQHPEMQRRLQQQTPAIDDALFSMTAYLGSQSKEELAELQSTLKRNRDAGVDIAEPINRVAKQIGVSPGRRAQVRSMLTLGAWRMAAQPPSLLIDDYVKTVQKVAARQGQGEQLKRYFATQIGDRVFWAHQRRLAQASGPPPTAPPAPPPRKFSSAPPPAAPTKKRARGQAPVPAGPPARRAVVRPVASASAPLHRRALEPEKKKPAPPGQGAVNAGLILMGFTAVLGAVGGGLMATPSWIVGAIMLTHGALTLLAGIICLIVGAVKNANAKSD